MKSLIVALASFCCVAAFGDTRYVVPGGTGDGSSWANGASLDSALASVVDGDIVLLRQGVHSVSTAVTLTNVKLTMRGGYAAGDADDAPSGDKYSTIISADAGLDNVWGHFDPETGIEEVVLDDGEPVKVIKDGALTTPPAYRADYDVYYPVEMKDGVPVPAASAVTTYLTMHGTATVDLENLTVSGFGVNTGKDDAGSFIHFPDNPPSTARIDLTFVWNNVSLYGNAGSTSIFKSPNSYLNPNGTITDCEVKFCRIDVGGAFFNGGWEEGLYFRNCAFESIFGKGCHRSTPIAISQTGRCRFEVKDASFKRLVHVNNSVYNTATTVGGFAVGSGVTAKAMVDSCLFDHCWVEETTSLALVTTSKYLYLDGCRFLDNVTRIRTNHAGCIQAAGAVHFSGDAVCIIDNSIFARNSVTLESALCAEAYGGIVVDVKQTGLIADSIFDSNSVALKVTKAGARTNFSRSILILLGMANGVPRVDTLNCTFTGSTPGDDVVLSATSGFNTVNAVSLKMAHLQDIFWSSATDYLYSGVTTDIPGLTESMVVQRSIVKNGGSASPNVGFLDCNSDDPMLVLDETTGVWKPSVAVVGSSTMEGAWYIVKKAATGAYTFHFGRESGTKNMYFSAANQKVNTTCLISRNGNYSPTDASSTAVKGDILGTARPTDGTATAGAVQTALPVGRILVAETRPAGVGSVTIGSQYASEDGFAEVTATSADPLYTFQKWVDENGETLSTSATYRCPSTKDYTRIRAVFGAPQAKWTFKVDPEKGTFANGETEIEMTLNPGDDAPAFPEVKVDPAWHQTGWDKAMPAAVGSADLEFNVTFIPYTKVVYFDTHATGANDGTSWENAYAKFADAVDNAGGNNSYVGEVRVRQGRHVIPNNQHSASFKNVKIIGGWTGNGEERSDDRRLTVFTGDKDDDDIFVDQHGNTVGKVYENGKFIEFRPPTEEEGYWELANYTNNWEKILGADDTVACTNARIEGCTFYGFSAEQTKTLTSGRYLNVTITNCDFIALRQIHSLYAGQVELHASSRVQDCAFYGITGAGLCFDAPDGGEVFELKGVKFLCSTRNFASGRVVTFIKLNKGSVQAEDLEVGHVTVCNYLETGTANQNTSGAIVWQSGAGGSTKPCWIKNGYFHDIRSPLNDLPARLLAMEACTDSAILENCVFENIEIASEYKPAALYKNADIVQVGTKTVTNCVFRNVSFDYAGAPEGAKSCALLDVKDGVYGTTFENCRLSSVMNMFSFFLVAKGIAGQPTFNIEIGDGVRFVNCSVTNLGVNANTQMGSAALLADRTFQFSTMPIRSVGKVLVKDCSVYAPGMANAFVIDDLGGGVVADGLTVVNNRVEGGTALAGVLRVCTSAATPNTDPATTLLNTTIAENTVVSEAPIVATVYRPYFLIDIGWSTFCGNVAPSEFYVVGNWKLNLTSSVVTSDADGWVAQKSSGNAQAANGIVFANSYVKGVDETSPYFSGENAFTVEPKMTGVVRNRRQRCYGVYHTPQSPYAHQVELAGVYSDEAATDAAGIARPPEGPVLIGAMQNTYAAPGLMLLVK